MTTPINRASVIVANSKIALMEQAVARLKGSTGNGRLSVAEAGFVGHIIRINLYDLVDPEGEYSDFFVDRTKPV